MRVDCVDGARLDGGPVRIVLAGAAVGCRAEMDANMLFCCSSSTLFFFLLFLFRFFILEPCARLGTALGSRS